MSNILLKLTSKTGKYLVNNDVLTIIKLFTGELHYRNGKYTKVNRIPRLDSRYEMLLNRPRIKQILNTDRNDHILKGSVWFKVNGKFMVFNVGYLHVWVGTHFYDGYITEVYYKGNAYLTHI
jgi:hypothetical protein